MKYVYNSHITDIIQCEITNITYGMNNDQITIRNGYTYELIEKSCWKESCTRLFTDSMFNMFPWKL